MPIFSCVETSALVPRASVLPRPLQHFEMSTYSSLQTSIRIPTGTVLSRPLQHFEMSCPSSPETSTLIPSAAILSGPLQHVEMSILRSPLTRFCIPRAAFLPRPLKHGEIPFLSCLKAQFSVAHLAVWCRHSIVWTKKEYKRNTSRAISPRVGAARGFACNAWLAYGTFGCGVRRTMQILMLHVQICSTIIICRTHLKLTVCDAHYCRATS